MTPETPEMTHIELTKEEKQVMRHVREEFHRLFKLGRDAVMTMPGIVLEHKGVKLTRSERTAPVNPITGPGPVGPLNTFHGSKLNDELVIKCAEDPHRWVELRFEHSAAPGSVDLSVKVSTLWMTNGTTGVASFKKLCRVIKAAEVFFDAVTSTSADAQIFNVQQLELAAVMHA